MALVPFPLMHGTTTADGRSAAIGYVYREHELFSSAALPVYANITVIDQFVEPDDVEPHGHDFLEIAVVGGGTGRHVCAHGGDDLRMGSVLVLRPGAWHGFAHCRNLVLAATCVSASALRADLSFLREDSATRDLLWNGPLASGQHGVLQTSVDPQDAAEIVEDIGLLQRRVAEQPDDRVLLLGQLLTVIGRIVSGVTGARRPAPVHAAIALVTARLDDSPEHPWQLDELARMVNLDAAYLTRLFRRHLGLPPMAYLARVRAEKAATLLARTSLPTAQVGAQVGWPDPTYFARRFRTLVGLTPSGYRRHLRRDADTHPTPSA